MASPASSSSSSSSSFLLHILYILSLSFFTLCNSTEEPAFKDVGLDNPILDLSPSPFDGYSPSGSKVIVSCERVRACGMSRLNIGSYANSIRITLTPSVAIPERFHSEIEVCFHRNASLGLCQCAKEDWRPIQKGEWSSSMSPYEERYLDVKFTDGITGSLIVAVEEEFQQWRLYSLAFGFVLLLFAPIVSNWVPFYYSSSMAIGVLLVVVILLFQGMKFLPTGRKNAFYLSLYGSVIGLGSYAVHYFSMLLNSVLANFGLNEEMHNPVSIFVLVGIILAGAALGYWIVRKYVVSEDGGVDVDIAQFVKWAIRIIAMAFIFQSTLDIPLAMGALASCWRICSCITSKWQDPGSVYMSHQASGGPSLRKGKPASAGHKHVQFIRSPEKASGRTIWRTPKKSFLWTVSPNKGLVLSSPNKRRTLAQDYYSTFHKVPNRKRFSNKEYEELSKEFTRQAVVELASAPEFADWMIDNADRIQLQPDDSSSDDESMDGGSISSEENVRETGSGGQCFFKWF